MAVTTYKVKKGDTLWGIAESQLGDGTKYKDLATWNDIENPDLIYIGQVIKLSKGSGSSSSPSDANKVTINHFGLQSDEENVLFATWTWGKTSTTEKYEVKWEYYTSVKLWFTGSKTDTDERQSTYSIPSAAKQVRVKVRPIAKTKGDSKTREWTATWSSYKTYSVVDTPDVPSVPTVTLDGLNLKAEVSNLKSDPSIIQFEVVKDDTTTYKKEKSAVTTSSASYSCPITAGSTYKVRCRAYRDNVWSDWSDYSSKLNTIPATPATFTKCEPKTNSSIYLEWASVPNADSYEIEYTTKKSNFDGSDQIQSKSGITTTSYEMSSGIEAGQEYFFRLRATNAQGSSGWSEISSTIIGNLPAAPTTWSSTTTVVVGEPLNLYWVHNSEDGSSQTYGHLEIYVDGILTIDKDIENSTKEDEKDKTSVYSIDTSIYPEGTQIQWRVQTAGISKMYGDWSIQRTVDIYAPPTLNTIVSDSNGALLETLESFPFNISALAGPNTQRPIGYHLSITANEFYETIDGIGNTKTVNKGEVVYSKYFDISEKLEVELSASDMSLENNISYMITCVVSMNSGLTAESSSEFVVSWMKADYAPNAEINFDEDTLSTYIRPYCAIDRTVYYKVRNVGGTYTNTFEETGYMYGEMVNNALTTDGYQVYYGRTADGVDTYFCIVEESIPVEDVTLSIYRREFDGSFTELATGLDGAKNTFITDPHPALDYARYRIVAVSKTTGGVNYYDPPGYPIGVKSIVIQWDEKWTAFDVTGIDDDLEQPPWSGSMLILPYNVDVSDKHSSDVSLVEYIGRKHPVSYYGTQLGETASWSLAIDKNDKDTLYALRRLAVWMGDVYVREPSGSGYWANVTVSFSQKHREVTIPVTIEIARVEGGA